MKKTFLLIFTFLILFIGLNKVNAYTVVSSLPSSVGPVTEGKCIYFTADVTIGTSTGDCSSTGVGFTHYKYSGNIPLSCIDYDKKSPIGITCTVDTSITEDQQIALAKLLIDKGMEITSSPDYEKYFWTQVIGQRYMRGVSLGYHGAYTDGYGDPHGAYYNDTINSVSQAEISAMNAYVNTVNNTQNVTISPSSITGWTYSNGYWVSNEFTYSGGTPTVSSSPSIDGITVTSTATSGKVSIKIPSSKITAGTSYNITLKIKGADLTYYKTSTYNCSGAQDVLTPYVTEHKKGTSKSITGTFITTGFSKQDVANSSELIGATLEILDSSKNHIDRTSSTYSCLSSSIGFIGGSKYVEWVSTNTPNIIYCLPNGTYYLREKLPAYGYKTIEDGNDIEFTISNGTVTGGTVVMENELTKVQISKKDATTKKELAGATLTLLDSDKNQIDLTNIKYANVEPIDFEFIENKGVSWISTGKKMIIQGLPIGVYYLVEEASPEGYDKTTEEIKIEITIDKVITEGEITNTLTVTVPNTGIDSKIFIIIGLNLVVIGSIVVYFTMRKRKKA